MPRNQATPSGNERLVANNRAANNQFSCGVIYIFFSFFFFFFMNLQP